MSSREFEIFQTGDGSHSLRSGTYGDSYHSTKGAIQESIHVFIEKGLLACQHLEHINILEFGFGTGLNAVLTWKYLLDSETGPTVHYKTLEAHPLPSSHYSKLNYGELLSFPHFLKLHTTPWNEPCALDSSFLLEKYHQVFEQIEIDNWADLVYYDAFGPRYQPSLWQKPMLEKVAKCMKSGGRFVTYCAQGAFRRTMVELGFEVERLPGPPGKREMIIAIKS